MPTEMIKELFKLFFLTSPALTISFLIGVIGLVILTGYMIKFIIKIARSKDISIQRKLLWIFVLLLGPLIIRVLLSFIGIETNTIDWLMIILAIVYYDIHKNYKKIGKPLP